MQTYCNGNRMLCSIGGLHDNNVQIFKVGAKCTNLYLEPKNYPRSLNQYCENVLGMLANKSFLVVFSFLEKNYLLL